MKEERLIFETKEGFVQLSFEDILYIEYLKQEICRIVTPDSEYLVNSTLKRLLEKFNDSFFQCNGSTIINFMNFRSWQKNSSVLVLRTGKEVNISFRSGIIFKRLLKEMCV